MILRYKLDADDHLNYQLYSVGLSKSALRKRSLNSWVVPLAFVLLGLFLRYRGIAYFDIAYIAIAVLWFFLYPKYHSWVVKRHFTKFVNENFDEADYTDEREIEIGDVELWGKNRLGESRFSSSTIGKVVEVPTAFYIMLPGNQTLVVSKKYVNVDMVRARLKEIAPYEDRNDWVWK